MKFFKQSLFIGTCLVLSQHCCAMNYLKNWFGCGSRHCVQQNHGNAGVERLVYEQAKALLMDSNERKEVSSGEHAPDTLRSFIVADNAYTFSMTNFGQGNMQEAISVDNEEKQNALRDVIVYDDAHNNKLKDVMYEVLDPMPLDLIKIILSYLPFVGVKGKCVKAFTDGYYKCPRALANGLVAVSDIDAHTICLIDPLTCKRIATFGQEKFEDVITDMVALPHNKLIVASYACGNDAKGKIRCFDCAQRICEREVLSGRSYVQLVKLSKNRFAALYWNPQADQNIRPESVYVKRHLKDVDIMSAPDGSVVRTIKSPCSIWTMTRLSPRQKLLAISTGVPDQKSNGEGSIRIYNWETGEQVRTFGVADYDVLLSLGNNVLAASGSLTTEHWGIAVLCIWDASTGTLLKWMTPLNARHEITRQYCFKPIKLPNHQIAYIGNNCLNIMDPKTGLCKHQVPFRSESVQNRNICTLPDGRLVLIDGTYSLDTCLSGAGRLQIWR